MGFPHLTSECVRVFKEPICWPCNGRPSSIEDFGGIHASFIKGLEKKSHIDGSSSKPGSTSKNSIPQTGANLTGEFLDAGVEGFQQLIGSIFSGESSPSSSLDHCPYSAVAVKPHTLCEGCSPREKSSW